MNIGKMKAQSLLKEGGIFLRLKITCELNGNRLPIDYRTKIMMMIKSELTKNNPQLYDALFKKNTPKFYTFSVFLPDARFTKEEITIRPDSELIINFSSSDAEILLGFFNVFMSLKDKVFPWSSKVHASIKSVKPISNQKIMQNEVTCRILSPIIARDHNRETRKTWFYTAEDERFEEILQRNLIIKYQEKFGDAWRYDIEQLRIVPLNCRKTVVRHYEKQIAATIGQIELIGKPHLLNLLLEDGLGSLCGSGFGMLETM